MNILIADSHILCREVMVRYFTHAASDLIIHEASDYGTLTALLTEQKMDMVLLEPDLPGLPMMENCRELDLSNPDMPIGMLARDAKSFPEGMHGCSVFSKDLSCKVLLEGIRQCMEEGCFDVHAQTPSFYTDELTSFQARKMPDDFCLTQREKDVMGFLVKGATNKDVARALNLQVVTVKLHVRGICRKMNAKNRTQAALIAKEFGWDHDDCGRHSG